MSRPPHPDLDVIQPQPAPPRSRWRPLALQLYRLAIVAAIVWIVRQHHLELRAHGDRPIELAEVVGFFPAADALRPDAAEEGGLFVYDAAGREIGYVVRTAPLCDELIGYSGPTDTLVALDNERQVRGIAVRHSWDTASHVATVVVDDYFMQGFNDLGWDEVAGMDFDEAGVEGVSGATMTSMNIATGVRHRFRHALRLAAEKPPLRFAARDAGLAVVVVVGLLLSFTRLRGQTWTRRGLQVAIIAYLGFYSGDMVAQALLAGWSMSGVAWRTAPGLVLLVAAALLVPWATRRPMYCAQLCPFGLSQELVGRLPVGPLHLSAPLDRGLKWLPPLLVAFVLLVVMLRLPFDLASLEPFDAYLVRAAGWATIAIAAVGLLAALFVPQAYCRYGCPTGAVLGFVRSHGRADRFGRRDVVAALLLGMTFLLWQQHAAIENLLTGMGR